MPTRTERYQFISPDGKTVMSGSHPYEITVEGDFPSNCLARAWEYAPRACSPVRVVNP